MHVHKSILIFIILLLSIGAVSGYSNSVTSDDSTTFTTSPGNVIFDTETSGLGYSWFVDGVSTGGDVDKLTYQFTEAGIYNVTVVYTGGSVTWYPTITRAMSSDTTERLDESAYEDIENATSGSFGLFGLANASTQHYVNSMGNFFYLFVIGITLVMMWKQQKNIIIPALFVLILADMIFSFIPEGYVLFGKLFIIIAATAVTVKLYLDSRTR
jgi:hypothetical protein